MKAKQAFIYADVEMPQGLKSPLLQAEGRIPFDFSSLAEAKKNLNKKLDDLNCIITLTQMLFLFSRD